MKPGARSDPRLLDLGWGAGASAAALAVAAVVLKLWHADLRVPFESGGDASYTSMLVKSVVEGGWYLENERLGAPFGQQLYDFPSGDDSLHLLALKLLGVFSGDWAVALNLYFLLGFVLAAATAFWVMRRFEVSRPSAAAAAVLFAVLPYHFLRGEMHLMLATYYSVPLGVYLALSVWQQRPLFGGGWKRTAGTIALAAVVASTSVYYAVFTGLLVLVAALSVAVTGRSLRRLVPGALVLAAIGTVLTLSMLPSIVHRAQNGANEQAAARKPAESDASGTSLAQLLLPTNGHRVEPLRKLRHEFVVTTPVPSEQMQALGLVASAGLLGLLAIAALSLIDPRRAQRTPPLRRHLSLGVIALLLVGAVGGFGPIWSYIASAQLRGWNRVSIFIGFMCLFLVAHVLDRAGRRLAARGAPRWVPAAGLAAVVLLGAYDQTSGAMVPRYGFVQGNFRAERDFFAAIERDLPTGAAVFQLPYQPFPEPPPQSGDAYAPMRAYLHTDDLRWSYGAMKGRDRDWQARLVEKPFEATLPALAAAGFAGIHIDRRAFADEARPEEDELRRVLGVEPRRNADNRLLFFDTRAYNQRVAAALSPAERERLRTALLKPFGISFGAGFQGETPLGADRFRWGAATTHIEIRNPAQAERTARLTGAVQTALPARATLTLKLPDGRVERLGIGPDPRRLNLLVRLRPGRNVVVFSTDAAALPGEPRNAHFRLLNPVVDDVAYEIRVPPKS